VGTFKGNVNFGSFNLNALSVKDMYIARFDKNGNFYGIVQGGKISSTNKCTVDLTGNIVVGGTFNDTATIGSNTFISYGGYDIFIAKSAPITGIQQRLANTGSSNQLLIYANPNTGKCNITVPDEFSKEENLTLRIFDNNGKLIQQQNIEMSDGTVKVNLEAEAKGVYNVTLGLPAGKAGNKKKSYNGKIVFE